MVFEGAHDAAEMVYAVSLTPQGLFQRYQQHRRDLYDIAEIFNQLCETITVSSFKEKTSKNIS
jgi:hypothetical protein